MKPHREPSCPCGRCHCIICGAPMTQSAYFEALAQAEKLASALEVYAMTNETFPEYGDVAQEALAEFQKWKDE